MRFMKKGIAVALAAAMVITLAPENGADAAKKVALNKKTANVTVGSTLKLKVKNAKKKAKVSWKTSNKKIAKISKKTTKGNATATIKGIKKGKATITATYTLGKKSSKLKCTVNVKKKTVATAAPTDNTVVTSTATPSPANTTVPSTNPTVSPDSPTAEPTAPGPTATPTVKPTPRPTPKPTPSADAQIYKTYTDIKVDGTVDNAWDFVEQIPISNWKAAEGKTAKTSNAYAKIMWTAEKLYVLVEAEDSAIDTKNDSVDLFVDEFNNKEEWGSEKKQNEFQYRTLIDAAAKNPGSFVDGKNQWNGRSVNTAVATTDNGYVVEFEVPLTKAPVEEAYIGIEIQINDASDGAVNGTWNTFVNPANGDKLPSESTLVFGECQYAVKRKPKEIALDFSNPDSTDMQLPDQFSVKDENGNIQYFDEDGTTVLSTQYIEYDDDNNPVVTYKDAEGNTIDAPVGKRIAADGVMNTKAKYDSENGLVYCETANNIVIYFPDDLKVNYGEKAAVKIEGTYTTPEPSTEEGAETVEVSDDSTVFRTWLVDTEDKKLKGDSPVTVSNQVYITYAEVKSEDGKFEYEGAFKADGPDKPASDGYESNGDSDALMIKAPSYNSTIGNLVLSKVTLIVYEPITNDNPSGGDNNPSGGDDNPSGGDDNPSGGDDVVTGQALTVDLSTASKASGNGAYDAAAKKLVINDSNGASEVHIALPETYTEVGTKVQVRVKGTYTGDSGFRIWIGNGSDGGAEPKIFAADFVNGAFDETFELEIGEINGGTIKTNNCDKLTIKAIATWAGGKGFINGLEITEITVKEL